MKQTAVEWLIEQMKDDRFLSAFEKEIEQTKEMEKKNLLEMLHKFGFDYTYNYIGNKTIYEYVDEWYEEYKRIEEKHKK